MQYCRKKTLLFVSQYNICQSHDRQCKNDRNNALDDASCDVLITFIRDTISHKIGP
jgi:hypothetical protein